MMHVERLAKEEQERLPASVRALYDFYFQVMVKGEKNERTSNNIAAERS